MRVLCLTPELPFAPGGSGGSTRQFHLLRRLVERGVQVEAVAPVHASQREGAVQLAGAGVRLHAIHRPASRAREAGRAVVARPSLIGRAGIEPVLAWQADVFWTSMRALARRAIAQRKPDVLLVEHDWAAAWASDLPDGIPSALTLHNLSWAYYTARARSATGLARRTLATEAARFRAHDRRLLPRYDLLVAMSDQDRAATQTLVPDVRCEIVPNGVDTSSLRPRPKPPNDPTPLLLYTGTLSYPPNAEGLLWLLREVWPQIRDRVPNARLRVVGRGAPAEAEALVGEDVELTGWVDSVEPHFAACDAVLVPILSGGGTRLKVLDAMSAGRAIVSTPEGWEGIDARPGEHLLSARGAEAFASAAVRVLEDAELRARLGTAARARAVESYDWVALGDCLHDLLADLPLACGRC